MVTNVGTGWSQGPLARPEGFEPPAYSFGSCRSIRLSYGRLIQGIASDRWLKSEYHLAGAF